jgi:hypothetical protein
VRAEAELDEQHCMNDVCVLYVHDAVVFGASGACVAVRVYEDDELCALPRH